MFTAWSKLRSLPPRLWASFSYVGLTIAALFFAASLTPSLLPRNFYAQGILSGFAIAAGYGLGVFFMWLWLYLEIPTPKPKTQRAATKITTVVIAIVVAIFMWRASIWQNSIRQLMDLEPVTTAYPLRVTLIAILTGVLLIATARG